MKLYIANVSQITSEIYHELLSEISEERRNRLKVCHHEMDKRRGMLGELLLQRAVREELGISPAQTSFGYGEKGKPYVKGYPEFHFNISHSRDIVLCAAGDTQVGADVQSLIVRPEKLVRKCLTKGEADLYHAAKNEDKSSVMTVFWCRKESYMKMTGQGLSLPMNLIEWSQNNDKVTLLNESGMIEDICFLVEPEVGKDYKSAICMKKYSKIEEIRNFAT